MTNCPVGKSSCPCEEYGKEGRCDWPYHSGMNYDEIRRMTQVLKVVDDCEERKESDHEQ
jgi:hypothetical protein